MARLGSRTSAGCSDSQRSRLPYRGGNDFAFGGAVTGSSVPGTTAPVPNITQQVDAFIVATGGPGHASSSALYTVWIGANDVLQAVSDIGGGTLTPTSAATDLASAAQTEANAVNTLARDGATQFLVPLVPAVGLTPDLRTTPLASLGTALAADYNTDLLADLAAVGRADGVAITTLDVFSSLENFVASAGTYGYTNVTDSCYTGSYTGGGTACSDPNQYLFWDGLHPTETGQQLIAASALAALVPEPGTLGLLVLGLCGVGVMRWRKVYQHPSLGSRSGQSRGPLA